MICLEAFELRHKISQNRSMKIHKDPSQLSRAPTKQVNLGGGTSCNGQAQKRIEAEQANTIADFGLLEEFHTALDTLSEQTFSIQLSSYHEQNMEK